MKYGGIMEILKNNHKLIFLLGCAVLIALFICYFCFLDHTKEEWWIKSHISFKQDERLGDSIYTVKKDERISIFDLKYQEIVENMIEDKRNSTSYTIDAPLMIYNPYGTNLNAINVYFEKEKEEIVSYTVSVEDDIPDFSATLKDHQDEGYQLIGLVPGYLNHVTIELKDKNGKVKQVYQFEINIEQRKNVEVGLNQIDGNSSEELENGLYAVLGKSKDYKANTYLYDNHGILRSELVIQGYRTDRFMWIDGEMVYNDSKDSIIFVNHLGKITKRYKVSGYKFHHDFEYDEKNHRFIVLANKSGEKTMEDYIITIDTISGEVKELIDMENLLPQMKQLAIMPEENDYTKDRLDWIHLNSIDLDSDGNLIVSSRELSTVIKIKDIDQSPKVAYLIGDISVWKDTKYENLVLEKIGDTIPNAGQHTATIITDETLKDGEYYLILFNNNTNFTYTRPNFDWSNYPKSAGYMGGENSYYQCYLVNENDQTYELINSISVPYSSIVSSVQKVGNHTVTNAGMAKTISEYDESGELIQSLIFDSEDNSYRTFKYDFNDFWFDNYLR